MESLVKKRGGLWAYYREQLRDIKVEGRTQMHAQPEEKQAVDGVPIGGMREGGKGHWIEKRC